MLYDIIIVGAGIAGVSTAIHAKKLDKNLKILIVDKAVFPRNKLCAGYLTGKSVNLLKELDIDISKIDYKLVKGISIIYKDKIRIHANNHGLYCQKLVDRTVLDLELFNKLKQYEIDIIENSNFFVNNEEFKYKKLVFADGQLGFSSKFNIEKKKYFAMQLNFKHEIKPKIDMFFGITKKGYAWCANSGSYTNIGFCDIYNKDINYKKVFEGFVKKLGYEKELSGKIKGFFVPYGLKKNKIIDNMYLVGDAVGTVDPLTLAGISYAILSGKYVASSIVKKDDSIYLKYLKKVNFKFRILKLMAVILYMPITLFLFLRVGGHFFGRFFSFVLDKFILNKGGSFHE